MRVLVCVSLLYVAACGTLPTSPPPDTSSFTKLYDEYLSACASCHAPGAPAMAGIEATLDFSSRSIAYFSIISGEASGLGGAQAACNGTLFVKAGNPTQSLIYAVLDPATQKIFKQGGCTGAAVTDEASKVTTAMPATFLADLSMWIVNGGNND